MPFYGRGGFPVREMEAVAAHLQTCPECARPEGKMRNLLDELQQAWRRALPLPQEEEAIQTVGWYIRPRPLVPPLGLGPSTHPMWPK